RPTAGTAQALRFSNGVYRRDQLLMIHVGTQPKCRVLVLAQTEFAAGSVVRVVLQTDSDGPVASLATSYR
ncbi:MAG: hypothetical protein AABZ47_16570, partial [Planctomycetota bacterium]